MYRIAICDDQPEHATLIAQFVRSFLSQQELLGCIDSFQDGCDLIEATALQPYHIALLDMRLPQVSGVTLAKQLNRIAPQCKIIFITAYQELSSDAYESEHIYWVLKSSLEKRLPDALRKAFRLLEQEQTACLRLQQKNGIVVLRCSEIQYGERSLRTTHIYTAQGAVPTPLSLDKVIEMLPASDFVRCHHSFFVGLAHVSYYGRSEIRLRSGVKIPISRSYSHPVKHAFMHYVEAVKLQ